MTITFTVPAIPVAQPRQRHRVLTAGGRTFAQNYTPAKHPVNAFKAAVQLAARQAYTGPPIEGPVSLAMTAIFPRPKRLMWKSRTMLCEWHTTKPDADNVVKAVKDALSGLLWRDDCQVCQLIVDKWIAGGDDQPGVVIQVEKLNK